MTVVLPALAALFFIGSGCLRCYRVLRDTGSWPIPDETIGVAWACVLIGVRGRAGTLGWVLLSFGLGLHIAAYSLLLHPTKLVRRKSDIRERAYLFVAVTLLGAFPIAVLVAARPLLVP